MKTATKVKSAVNTIETLAQVLSDLKYRWQDEREYEDFADYINAVKAKLPEGATFTSLTKTFELRFSLADGTPKWMRVKGNGVMWGGFTKK